MSAPAASAEAMLAALVREAVREEMAPVRAELEGAFLGPLWPVLKAWRLRTGGRGLLFPPSLTATPR